MPYSKAHYFLIALLLLTIIAFWPSYFGVLNKASLAHHLHGLTATIWLLLIAFQNYLAHSKNLKLHRITGKILFLIIPMMVGSFALVTLVGAQKSVAGHPFYSMFGQALLTVDFLLIFAVPLTIYLALKNRRNPKVHSGYMIASIIGLIPPILSRLLVNIIPAWKISGPDTLQNFAYGLHASLIITVFMALALFMIYKPHNKPWVFATIVSVLVYFVYLTIGQTQAWQNFAYWLAEIPALAMFSFGFVIGLLACIFGWKSIKQKG